MNKRPASAGTCSERLGEILGEPPQDTSWAHHMVFLCLSALGDLILSLPLIQAGKSICRNAKVTIVCSRPLTAEFAKDLQVAEEVVLLPAGARRSPVALLRGLWLMRSLRADMAFQTFASHGAFANLLLGVTGARIRCGFSDGRFFNLLTHCTKLDAAKHYTTLNMDLLRRLGHVELQDPQGRYLPFIESHSEKFPVAGLDSIYGRYAVISISSDPKLSFKRWGVEKWRRLSRALSGDGFALLFVGGPADREDISEILKAEGIRGENMAGKTSFKDLAALIQGSRIVIGTDGMVLHFAAAMDKPCVGIFGPTNENREGPWRQMQNAARLTMPCSPCYSSDSSKLPIHCKTQECLRFLPVEKVYQQVLHALANPTTRC